ncbi:MAG: hypothetical protein IPL61_11505 [Myxococcales bacterium]|nr:hypothetical protein [Myxococcales bacterium]
MHMRLVALAALAVAAPAAADGPPPPTDSFPFRPEGCLTFDGGLVVGSPSALPTGLSTGVGAGASRGAGWLQLGARLAWSGATESTSAWTVSHDDIRVRVSGLARYVVGRGAVGVRASVGPTVVYERRSRNQGARAGLEGDALATSAVAVVPAIDLEAVIGVAVMDGWGLRVAVGPSLARASGANELSWLATLGASWTP